MTFRSACCVLFTLLAGCGNGAPSRDADLALGRILHLPANEIFADAKFTMVAHHEAPTLKATVTAGKDFPVCGSFRTIGEAAAKDFVPEVIMASVVQKNRDGFWVIHASCFCVVSEAEGKLAFQGEMPRIAQRGQYVLEATFLGKRIAQLPLTAR